MTDAEVPGVDGPGTDAAGTDADRPDTDAAWPDGEVLPAVGGSADPAPAALAAGGATPSGATPSGAPAAATSPTEARAAAARVAELALGRAARLGPVRLVCVDGPAGSGKSTFAAALAGHLTDRGVGAAVLHLDDLYAGWSGLDGDLAPRLSAQVLEPLRRGRAGRYQRYDWPSERFADWVDVPVPQALVVEGCGAGRRAVTHDAVVLVWVEAPAPLRLDRGLERDGAAMRPHWERWMHDEQVHFRREGTADRADVRLDAYGRMVE
ncbi:uridine kinase family protein [Cellulomonas sp. NS3]|uniref:uridine kinase family protein n=1 Tax=Cellulomonas sp. NS3 TaxID=2973977 RepID=UPI0021618B0D|nr:uridine kinase [Cellulomonas sp. NS3]